MKTGEQRHGRVRTWMKFALVASTVLAVVSAGFTVFVFTTEGGSFPSASAAGVRTPDEIECRSIPFIDTECERLEATYTAVYVASEDPAAVSVLIRGMLEDGITDSGHGGAALTYYDTQLLNSTDASRVECGRNAYLRAAYGIVAGAHMTRALLSPLDLVLASGKVPASQKVVIEAGRDMAADGGMVERIEVEEYVRGMTYALVDC